VGSLVCGAADFIHRARRARKRLGGGMRQAGIIAACGLVALETMVTRLKEDHANAKALALALRGIDGLIVNPDEVETNMVFLDVSGWCKAKITVQQLDSYQIAGRLEKQGVLASEMDSRTLRLVTHRHFHADQIPAVVAAFQAISKSLLA
jgi:threonine aldolase